MTSRKQGKFPILLTLLFVSIIYRGIIPCIPYGPSSLNVGSGVFPGSDQKYQEPKGCFSLSLSDGHFPGLNWKAQSQIPSCIGRNSSMSSNSKQTGKQDPCKLSHLKSKPLLGHLDYTGLFWPAPLNILFLSHSYLLINFFWKLKGKILVFWAF